MHYHWSVKKNYTKITTTILDIFRLPRLRSHQSYMRIDSPKVEQAIAFCGFGGDGRKCRRFADRGHLPFYHHEMIIVVLIPWYRFIHVTRLLIGGCIARVSALFVHWTHTERKRAKVKPRAISSNLTARQKYSKVILMIYAQVRCTHSLLRCYSIIQFNKSRIYNLIF